MRHCLTIDEELSVLSASSFLRDNVHTSSCASPVPRLKETLSSPCPKSSERRLSRFNAGMRGFSAATCTIASSTVVRDRGLVCTVGYDDSRAAWRIMRSSLPERTTTSTPRVADTDGVGLCRSDEKEKKRNKKKKEEKKRKGKKTREEQKSAPISPVNRSPLSLRPVPASLSSS